MVPQAGGAPRRNDSLAHSGEAQGNANENADVAANGGRARFRDVGNVAMEFN
jgi:hypothetical protein